MTPERMQHLLGQIGKCACLDELRGMRGQLSVQGEMQQVEIYRALEDRFTALAPQRGLRW